MTIFAMCSTHVSQVPFFELFSIDNQTSLPFLTEKKIAYESLNEMCSTGFLYDKSKLTKKFIELTCILRQNKLKSLDGSQIN